MKTTFARLGFSSALSPNADSSGSGFLTSSIAPPATLRGRSTNRRGPWSLAVLALALAAGLSPAGAQDSESYLVTQIALKQEQIRKTTYQLSLAQDFLDSYDTKMANIDAADANLETIRGKLAGIQRDNLVKLTIKMGITTWTECSGAVSFAKGAVEKVISTGVRSAALSLAYDQLKDKLQEQVTNPFTDPVKEALGLDEESLNGPRTVKIGGVNTKALAVLPELNKINNALNLTIEGAQALAFNRDGLDLGPVGALLYKNESIRNDFIPAARAKLDALRTEITGAKPGVESDATWLQGELESLNNALANFGTRLVALRADLAEDARQQAIADILAGIPPKEAITIGTRPPDPPPYPIQGNNESDESYHARLSAYNAAHAAIVAHRALVEEYLKTECLALEQQRDTVVAEIADLTAERNRLIAVLDWRYGAAGTVVDEFGGSRKPPLNAAFSITGLMEYESFLHLLQEGSQAVTALAGDFATIDVSIQEKCTSLAALEPQHEALMDLRNSTARDVNAYYPPVIPGGWFVVGGVAHSVNSVAGSDDAAAAYAAESNSFSESYVTLCDSQPTPLALIGQLHAKVVTAFPALVKLAEEYQKGLEESLTNAQNAMDASIAAAADYHAAIVAAETATGRTAGAPYRYGYRDQTDYANWVVVPVFYRGFSFYDYRTALADALGADNLTKADTIIAAYATLRTAHASFRHKFTSANNHFASYFKAAGTNGTPNWSPLSDWKQAAAFTGSTLAVPTPPDLAALERRFYHLQGFTQPGWLDYSHPSVANWFNPLPNLADLPDPGLDSSLVTDESFGGNSDNEMTAYYDLLALRKKWNTMPWDSYGATEFGNVMSTEFFALWDLRDPLEIEDATRFQAAFTAAQQHLQAINSTHSFPISITTQPENRTIAHNHSATFTVGVAGEVSRCDWYERSYYMSPDDYSSFTLVQSSASTTYTTQPLQSNRYYYVEVFGAGGGSVRSTIVSATIDPNTVPPFIWSDLQPKAIPAGMPVTLSVQTSYNASITISWYRNGAQVQSGPSNQLVLGSFNAALAGNYQVRVSNAAGMVEGNTVPVTLAGAGTAFTYQNWAEVQGGAQPYMFYNPSADGLGLGAPNILCYALGAAPGPRAARLHPSSAMESGKLVMRFRKPRYVSGVIIHAEMSSDLSIWTREGVELVKESQDDEDEIWLARPLGASPTRVYLRIAVE